MTNQPRAAALVVILAAATALAGDIPARTPSASGLTISRHLVATGAAMDFRSEMGWAVDPAISYAVVAWCGPDGGCQWYADMADGSVREGDRLDQWEVRVSVLPPCTTIRWKGDGVVYVQRADGKACPEILPAWRCLRSPMEGGYEQRCAGPWR